MWKDETAEDASKKCAIKEIEGQKAINDKVKEFFEKLNSAPKIFKIFVCFVIIFVIQINFFPLQNITEADRMRNRISVLQDDINEKAKIIGYENYASAKAANEARKAIVNGLSSPLGPSEADRKQYQSGISEMQGKDEITNDLIKQIASDKAEIENIQKNLDSGVYKEK